MDDKSPGTEKSSLELPGKTATEVVQRISDFMKSRSDQPAQTQTQTTNTNGTPYDFGKVHLHIGIPCYGGMVSEPTMTSLLKFVLMAQRVGLHWSLDTMVNESLITRGRNNLMAKMMSNKAATHFMFIDADIRFEPEAIFNMLVYEKEVIGGLYPKKSIPSNYVINLLPQTKIQGDVFTVDTMGTGFLIFKRQVYEKLCAVHPETKYVDDVGLGKEHEPNMYAIFDVAIDEKGHYLSEDWLFCRRWQKAGGEIWAHSKVLLNHIGHYEYKGDLSQMPQFGKKSANSEDVEQDTKKILDQVPA